MCIFLENFRGPRKTYLLKIVRSKRAGDHGALWAKSKNFQGLVLIPNMGKLLLDLKTARKKYKSVFRWPQNGRSRYAESSDLSGEECFLPTTATKT